MGYQINQINSSTYQILDEYDGCIYAIKGKKQGLIIDTGMSRQLLKPVIDNLISTPYAVVLTHGHIDHIGRSQEFPSVYMSHRDQKIYQEHTHLSTNPNDRFHIIGLAFQSFDHIKDIHQQQVFSLGDREIIAIPCYGHTPGSFLFADMLTHCLFTGDAIRSGCGVWMQVEGALSIQEYLDSLQHTITLLKEYHIDHQWTFYGGHAHQEYQSHVSSYNRLDFQLLCDMKILCERLLQNQVEFQDTKATAFSTGKPYYACYQKAEMILTKNQI